MHFTMYLTHIWSWILPWPTDLLYFNFFVNFQEDVNLADLDFMIHFFPILIKIFHCFFFNYLHNFNIDLNWHWHWHWPLWSTFVDFLSICIILTSTLIDIDLDLCTFFLYWSFNHEIHTRCKDLKADAITGNSYKFDCLQNQK